MWLRFLTLLAAMFTGLLIRGQEVTTFEAGTDARQVIVGNYFEVYFTLRNAAGKDFVAPAFAGFKVVSGPNQSVSTSMVNGQVTQQSTWSFGVIATKPGTFSIGSASIRTDGKKLSTALLTIEVLNAPSPGARRGAKAEPIFLVAQLSDSVAYAGQQVLLDFKIYTSKDVDSYNLLQEPTYDGMYSQEQQRYESRLAREVLQGVQYTTKVLKRVALFPQQTGTFDIGPMTLQVGVLADEQDSQRDIFFFRDVQMVNVSSAPVTLTAKPLPPGSPSSFCGGVGHYTLDVQMSNQSLSTDDVLSIRLVVAGDGDARKLFAPKLQLPAGLEVYEPKMLEENTFESAGKWMHTKTFEYLVSPQTAGQFPILPELSYFDTDSARYVRLAKDAVMLDVGQGSRKKDFSLSGNAATPSSTPLQPIKTETTFHRRGQHFWGSVAFWILLLLPLLLLAGVWWLRRRSALHQRADKLADAKKLAKKHLEKARQYLLGQDARAFYDKISRSLTGYICGKLDIPVSALSKPYLCQKMAEAQISEALISDLFRLLDTCEVALYAGHLPQGDLQSSYDAAVTIIARMEEHFKQK